MRASKETRLSYTEKAQALVDQMTLEQKVWLMSGNIDFTKMSKAEFGEFLANIMKGENHYNIVPYEAG